MKPCRCPSALRHGLARKAKVRPQDVDQRQLRMGIEEERQEHAPSSKCAAQCIALDHLAKIPDYYTRLAKLERAAGGRK